ncbi:MAG: amino acid permease [Flavobacteriaceae bacterium]|nr:amino acid permease [Flavobacteriaceae bacterium]|tara:strand:+ start:23138 stop:24199 length:1062 start_codon:yes stop_codon:yes gene_type:complete
MSKAFRWLLALSIFPQILMLKLLTYYPQIVETYYSNLLYPFISRLFHLVFGWLAFSVGDLIYTMSLIFILRWLYNLAKKGFKQQGLKDDLIRIMVAVSSVYFMFHLLWGLNYYRIPIEQRLNLNYEYKTKTLIEVTQKLILYSNSLHSEISKDRSKRFEIPYDFKKISKKVAQGYKALSISYPFLAHGPPSQKQSLYSLPLAYMGFSGYLNPFTNEAQVNSKTPVNSMPLTLAHEQAHQLGYAAEDEANFVAFLATHNHKDPYLRYAAYTFALRYCLKDLYKRDKTTFEALTNNIHLGITKDFRNREKQWAQFENPLEPIFKRVYGGFLKANQQTQGIESYNQVVALVVNYMN